MLERLNGKGWQQDDLLLSLACTEGILFNYVPVLKDHNGSGLLKQQPWSHV